MKNISSHPMIYEINTWVWLNDLSQRFGRVITLGSIPAAAWDELAALHMDAVWLMGVWERSPYGASLALKNPGLMAEFHKTLPDFHPEDVVGSPYCVRRYQVDAALGGPLGLASARQELANRGLSLILDFVPNHVAPDHPWVESHPEYFIQGTDEDLISDSPSFFKAENAIIAHGKDPNFPAWPDVAQLNAFHPGLREAVEDTLLEISAQCDGLRCDMAMLMFNRIFLSTWGMRAGAPPKNEFWPGLIQSVRMAHPDFVWIAEAYWDTEAELIAQGFDYCYDKITYDLIRAVQPVQLKAHLEKIAPITDHLIRFIENHDEARAASAFDSTCLPLAALLTTTLPGGVIFHEGQLEGRKTRLPVFLGRRPTESDDLELKAFYLNLLEKTSFANFSAGDWSIVPITPVPNKNPSSMLAWQWQTASGRYWIFVNLAPTPTTGNLPPEFSSGFNPFEDLLLTLQPNTITSYNSTEVQIHLHGWQAVFARS